MFRLGLQANCVSPSNRTPTCSMGKSALASFFQIGWRRSRDPFAIGDQNSTGVPACSAKIASISGALRWNVVGRQRVVQRYHPYARVSAMPVDTASTRSLREGEDIAQAYAPPDAPTKADRARRDPPQPPGQPPSSHPHAALGQAATCCAPLGHLVPQPAQRGVSDSRHSKPTPRRSGVVELRRRRHPQGWDRALDVLGLAALGGALVSTGLCKLRAACRGPRVTPQRPREKA